VVPEKLSLTSLLLAPAARLIFENTAFPEPVPLVLLVPRVMELPYLFSAESRRVNAVNQFL
jgi:hypothetical protein